MAARLRTTLPYGPIPDATRDAIVVELAREKTGLDRARKLRKITEMFERQKEVKGAVLWLALASSTGLVPPAGGKAAGARFLGVPSLATLFASAVRSTLGLRFFLASGSHKSRPCARGAGRVDS